MSRNKRRSKGKKAGVRGWITFLLLVLLGFFALSIYVGYRESLREPPAVQQTVLEVPPPVVPDAGSPTLVVWNGCGVPGLGERVSRWLRRQGLDVYETCNADRMDYPQTLVVARSRRHAAARSVAEQLQKAFGVGLLVERRTDAPQTDVLLILGDDFPDSLPVY